MSSELLGSKLLSTQSKSVAELDLSSNTFGLESLYL